MGINSGKWIVNLFRSEGVMYGGREILTKPVLILLFIEHY